MFIAKSTGYVEVNGDNVCSSTPSESRGWVIGPIHFQCLTLFQEGMAASLPGSWACEQRRYDKVCAITQIGTLRGVMWFGEIFLPHPQERQMAFEVIYFFPFWRFKKLITVAIASRMPCTQFQGAIKFLSSLVMKSLLGQRWSPYRYRDDSSERCGQYRALPSCLLLHRLSPLVFTLTLPPVIAFELLV